MSRLTRTSILLATLFAVDKGLGIIRQLLIARQFGLSAELDAFNAANNLPDLLFALISGGALAIAFLPALTEALEKGGRPAAWGLFSRIANLAFLVTAALALVILVLAEPLVGWEWGVAPGFTPQLQSLVAGLMRLNLIATLIFSISGLVMAGLQAQQHFLLPALAPIFYNVGQIFGVVILAPGPGETLFGLPGMGLGVHGLLYGVILGAALHLLIQAPGLLRFQFRWVPALGVNTPAVRSVLRLLGPRLLTMLFIQLTFLARDNLASRLEQGAVSALTYGWMIMQVPETLIGTAIATALLPTLSEHAVRANWLAFRETVERAFRVLAALTIPVAVVLSVGLGPLLALAFDLGPEGNALVLAVSRAYLAGILGHSLLEVAARAWYAQQIALIPLAASAINAVLYAVLGWLLFRPFGAVGVALANTLAFTFEAVLLMVWLNRRLAGQGQPRFSVLGAAGRGAAAGVVSAALVFGVLLVGAQAVPAWIAAIAGMTLGGLLAIPLIFPEIRQLARL